MHEDLRSSWALRVVCHYLGAAAGVLCPQPVGHDRDDRRGARGDSRRRWGASGRFDGGGSSHHGARLGPSLLRERRGAGDRLWGAGGGPRRGAARSPRRHRSVGGGCHRSGVASGDGPAGVAGGRALALRLVGVRREPAGCQHELALVRDRQTPLHASSALRGPQLRRTTWTRKINKQLRCIVGR